MGLSSFAASPELIVRVIDRSIVVRGRHLDLPRREFEIALALVTQGGTVRSSTLGNLVWSTLDTEAAADFAKVYVNRLRRRFGPDRDLITTTTSGYRLTRSFALDIELIGESLSALRIPTSHRNDSRVYDAIFTKLDSLRKGHADG